jgi:hypothetical protein
MIAAGNVPRVVDCGSRDRGRYNERVIARRQFSLASLLVATAFVAAACAALRLMFGDSDRTGKVFGFLMLPILLCGGVGSIRGRLVEWLVYGVTIFAGIVILILAD